MGRGLVSVGGGSGVIGLDAFGVRGGKVGDRRRFKAVELGVLNTHSLNTKCQRGPMKIGLGLGFRRLLQPAEILREICFHAWNGNDVAVTRHTT